jgi:hypothetical protein
MRGTVIGSGGAGGIAHSIPDRAGRESRTHEMEDSARIAAVARRPAAESTI